MNSDIVKPMPASAPAPASCRQEYSAGFTASRSRTASAEAPTQAERLADDQTGDDGEHQRLVAAATRRSLSTTPALASANSGSTR